MSEYINEYIPIKNSAKLNHNSNALNFSSFTNKQKTKITHSKIKVNNKSLPFFTFLSSPRFSINQNENYYATNNRQCTC